MTATQLNCARTAAASYCRPFAVIAAILLSSFGLFAQTPITLEQLDPNVGPAGTSTVVASVTGLPGGSGYTAAGSLTLTTTFGLPATNVSLTPQVGFHALTFTVPAGTPSGVHQVSVTAVSGGTTYVSGLQPFTVTPPTSIVLNPTSGQRGQTLGVQITGTNTVFSQGTTTVSFGPDITVTPTISSNTGINAQIAIGSGAALGARTVTVTTTFNNGAVQTSTASFTVLPGAITLGALSPNTGPALTGPVTATVTGLPSGATFAAGDVTVTMTPPGGGAAITVPGATLTASGGAHSLSFTVPQSAAAGAYNVVVTAVNGGNTYGPSNAQVFTIPPASLSLNPASGNRGQALTVTITGVNTNFNSGTTVGFGPDVTVGAVTATNRTSLSVPITIGLAAALNARTVTVTSVNSGVTETATATFTIGSAQSLPLTLSALNPNLGPVNTAVTATVQGLPSGTTVTAGQITLTMSTATTTLTVPATLTPLAGGGHALAFNVPTNAALGGHNVVLTVSIGNQPYGPSNAQTFTVGAPAISLTPSSAPRGLPSTVTIKGSNTNFGPGTTVSFGPDITVGTITVSGQDLTVPINIAAAAALGSRTVTVTTGSEVVTSTFTVNPALSGTPTIDVSPGSVSIGSRALLTITGTNTAFNAGTTVSFGPGITVESITVQSATSMLVQITVPYGTALGARTVTVTGGAAASVTTAFSVVQNISATPFRCRANTAVPPIVRSEGYTELTGDIVLVCTGGTAGQAIPMNLQLFLNTNITSRILSNGESEALLIVDELASAPGATLETPALYRGTRVTNSENAIVWPGVTLLAPGTGERILRITNVRANASLLGNSATLVPTQVVAYISASPTQSVPIDNPQQTVAFIQQGMLFDVTSCSGGSLSTPVNTNQCQGANADWFGDPLRSSAFAAQFGLRFREGFQTAFKPRIVAGQQFSIPGQVFNSESGFVRTTGTAEQFGALGSIGVADTGTRLAARFVNVPSNVRIFVATANVTQASIAIVPGPTQPRAVLVTTDAAGSSSIFGVGQGSVTPITPVFGPTRLTCAGGEYAAIEVPVTNGSGLAVWEVDNSNPSTLDEIVIPAGWAYRANVSAGQPALGTAQVIGNLAPFYGTGAAERASSALTIPRFVQRTEASNVFRINQCVTNLLFPYVTNQAGFDTGIAISNTSQDNFGSPADRLQGGRCTINYYGRLSNGNPPTTTREETDREVGPGEHLTFILSSGGSYGLRGNPGFQGYLIAQCGFLYAHGFAFITDGPIGSARVAEGYLALVLDGAEGSGRLRGSTLGESRAH